MALKLKYAWWCVLAILGVLAFFNVFSWPHNSQAAMKLLTAIDAAIFRPAAHPTILALVVGLAIGTVFIPEIWRIIREHVFPSKPHPNMDLKETIDYLRIRSRWAVGRAYSKNECHLLEEDIDTVIRDAATQGRLTVWGRPRETGVHAMFEPSTEIEIPRTEWPDMPLDLTTMVESDAPRGVCARDRAQGEDRYCQLRVDRTEVYREWPPAFYGRLLFDKTWKGRKQMIVSDTPAVHAGF